MLKGQVAGAQVPETLQRLVAPHIESFDYFIGDGLQEVVRRLPPVEVRLIYKSVPEICQIADWVHASDCVMHAWRRCSTQTCDMPRQHAMPTAVPAMLRRSSTR